MLSMATNFFLFFFHLKLRDCVVLRPETLVLILTTACFVGDAARFSSLDVTRNNTFLWCMPYKSNHSFVAVENNISLALCIRMHHKQHS
jgi:hypothetical protein